MSLKPLRLVRRRSRPRRSSHSRGFALIITVSLMILLSLLAVGLLTLSGISLASSTRSVGHAEARANARLALQLAIAQLQRQTGPDQRITTTADQRASAAEGRRQWTGVFRSWPDTAEQRPEPEFLSWLVSGPDTEISRDATADSTSPPEDRIELVGAGTVGDSPTGRVHAPVTRIERAGGESARIAWWVGDQGTKAALSNPLIPESDSRAINRLALQAAPRSAVELTTHGSTQPFKSLDPGDSRIALINHWPQSDFLASDRKASRSLFHDLAPASSGLLTNVRAGGFRKDLSMELERSPGRETKTALYQVRRENGINLQELWGYYNLYKDLEPRGRAAFTTGGTIGSDAPYLQLERSAEFCKGDDSFFYKQPVVISYQMALSFELRTVTDESNRQVNRLHLVADPILTFWNPLDVPVVVPRTSFFSVKYWQIPYDLFISVNGAAARPYPMAASLSRSTLTNASDGNFLSLRVGELEQLVFKPGEVIKVSQSGNTIVKGSNPVDHNLAGRSGFNYGGGVSLPVRDITGRALDINPADTITYEARPNHLTAGKTSRSGNSTTGGNAHTRHFSMTHHELYVGTDRDTNSLGIGGMYIDWDFGNMRLKPGQTRNTSDPGTKPSSARLYANRFPEIFRSIEKKDGRLLTGAELSARKAPFMLISYNAKTENGSDLGTRFLNRFNPKALHVDFYDLSDEERDILPYEFSVEALTSWKNRSLEVSTNGNAYFGGGMNAEFGTSYISTHSIPREPLVSLAAFQHSFANGFEFQRPAYGYAALNAREPMLPQISHAIGNSSAPAMIAPDQTSAVAGNTRPLADHSYLANQALWDDWFLSGIAPQEAPSFDDKRDQRTVAREFFEGTGKLPVARFRAETGAEDADALVSRLFGGASPRNDATVEIASLIRVDGLFNVNSTSVEAWKAVLGSLKGRRVVVRDDSGSESLAFSGEDIPVANLHAAADVVADGSGSVDVKDPNPWIGRRTLSEDEIDSLARAIVTEVRKRGPFLSLADFINRRVGSDKELARAGAIQAALDSKEADINSAYQSGGRAVSSSVASRFVFPEAEEGPLATGIPGIVKQADILTPIGPILSARSDSFIIRTYGESVDRSGNVLARAWCEAVVERDNDYLDPRDDAFTTAANLKQEVNRTFGRRYQVTSFRWLHPEEV